MDKYIYDGPVYLFNERVNDNWHGETMAISEKKAKSNLIYQYKRQTNRTKDCKIRLNPELVQKV